MSLTSPLKLQWYVCKACQETLMKGSTELQALLQRQVYCWIQNQPPVCPWFSEMTCTCQLQVCSSHLSPYARLLRWIPSGIAAFSILNSSNFPITCSDISLFFFSHVYSMSPGQFTDLFLAFSLKLSWESQNEVRRANIQGRRFNFLS